MKIRKERSVRHQSVNKGKKGIKGILKTLVIVSVIVFGMVPMVATSIIYEQYCGRRFTTPEFLIYKTEEFENLQRIPLPFRSNKGQKLMGYLYEQKEAISKKAVIVMSHRLGGGGHISFMPEINYFVQKGYAVFAYDGTGNDESEGKSIIGVPQAVIDLDYALMHIQEQPKTKELPIMLYGSSWGGYAVTNMLSYDHAIIAVVACAGFNKSQNGIVDEGVNRFGRIIKVIAPYAHLYEKIKFGKVADLIGVDGLRQTDAKVMLIHSKDDNKISYENNFVVYEKALKDRGNITFVPLKDRGHRAVVSLETIQKYKQKDVEGAKIIEKYGSVKAIPKEVLAAYNADYKTIIKLDDKIMEQIVRFYDKALEEKQK